MKKPFPVVPRQPVSIVVLKVDGCQTNCTSLYMNDTVEMLKSFLAENEGIPKSLQSLYLENGSDVELADDRCLGSFLSGPSNTAHLQQLAAVLVVREAPQHDHFNQATLPTGSWIPNVSSDGSKATGSSNYRPIRGSLICKDGKHEWRVMVAGDNNMLIGVVRSNADANTGWYKNPGCWGIRLDSRYMRFAGQNQQRGEGPDRFKLPCEVTIILDCGPGTLSIGVEGQMPVTVVCTSLPKKGWLSTPKFHFSCSTYNRACSVQMLSYKRS